MSLILFLKFSSTLSIETTMRYFIASFLYDLLLNWTHFCDEQYSLWIALGDKFYFFFPNFLSKFCSFSMMIWDEME